MPKVSADLKLFLLHLEAELEARFEIADGTPGYPKPTPVDMLKAVLDSVASARKELGL